VVSGWCYQRGCFRPLSVSSKTPLVSRPDHCREHLHGLGFQTEGLIGTEFTGNQTIPDGTTAVFHLDGGLMLSIYPRSELAKDALVPVTAAKPGEFSIGHAAATRAEVDEVISQARAAGATVTDAPRDRPWGIYSGYFQDPDGHLWEVIWNPALDLASS
jgi:uncharacterized protein